MLRSSLLLVLLTISAAAGAEGFDYNFLNFGYGTTEFDDIDVDGDGFGVGGSFAVSDSFHVFAGYSQADLDFDVDATAFNAGIGHNMPLSEVVDLVTQLSYEYVEVDVPLLGDTDDNGFGLGVGLRFAATDALELNGGIQYVDLSDSGDDTAFGVGGLYNFTDAFAVFLSGDWSDDATAYSIGGRFYFGQ